MTPGEELKLRDRLDKGGLTPKQELAIRERLSKSTQAAPKESPFAQTIRSVAEGASFGFSDELAAAADTAAAASAKTTQAFGPRGAPESPGLPFIGKLLTDAVIGKTGEFLSGEKRFTGYGPRLAKERAAQEAVPGLQRLAGNITGGLMTGLGGGRAAVAGAPTLTNQAARGAMVGGTAGGLYGYGSGRGAKDRLNQAAQGAVTGAATGGLLGLGSGALARRAARRHIPTTERLEQFGNRMYERVDKMGVVIRQDSFAKTVAGIEKRMAKEGIDATLDSKAMAALQRLMEAKNENITMKGAQVLRRVIQSARNKATDRGERRLASIMLRKFDDYIENLGDADVLNNIPGLARRASKSLQLAKQTWARYRKADFIENLIQRAEDSSHNYSQSGFENALRREFRTVMRNDRVMRTFSKAEQAAIRKVATGGKLANFYREFGKYAFKGPVASALGGGTGAVIGSSLIGGPVGGAIGAGAVGAIGGAGRLAATRTTAAAAQRASEIARSGGRVAAPYLSRGVRRAIGPAVVGGSIGVQRPARSMSRALSGEVPY